MVISIGATNIADTFEMNNFYFSFCGNDIYTVGLLSLLSILLPWYWSILTSNRTRSYFALLFRWICRLFKLPLCVCVCVPLSLLFDDLSLWFSFFLSTVLFLSFSAHTHTRSNVFWPFLYFILVHQCTDLQECFLFFPVCCSLAPSFTLCFIGFANNNNQHHIRIITRYVCYCLPSFWLCCFFLSS